MEYVLILLTVAVVIGACVLIDFLFKKLFRSQAQHMSGLAVRLHKRYGSFGIIMVVLGIAAIIAGVNGEMAKWLFLCGGILIVLVGIGLVVYYMSTGIFYDEDSFLYTTFGKKKRVYAYRDIQNQQLYNNAGYLLIELHMLDGTSVQVQSTMPGAIDFMDHAFAAWLRQTGKEESDCDYYDRSHSVWFPPVEV